MTFLFNNKIIKLFVIIISLLDATKNVGVLERYERQGGKVILPCDLHLWLKDYLVQWEKEGFNIPIFVSFEGYPPMEEEPFRVSRRHL